MFPFYEEICVKNGNKKAQKEEKKLFFQFNSMDSFLFSVNALKRCFFKVDEQECEIKIMIFTFHVWQYILLTLQYLHKKSSPKVLYSLLYIMNVSCIYVVHNMIHQSY